MVENSRNGELAGKNYDFFLNLHLIMIFVLFFAPPPKKKMHLNTIDNRNVS